MVINSGNSSDLNSPTFLKIRLAALGKAFNDIRRKRLDLDFNKDKGHISEAEYQSSLLKLIIESNDIRNQQEELHDRLHK
jgi:hypothetical protein